MNSAHFSRVPLTLVLPICLALGPAVSWAHGGPDPLERTINVAGSATANIAPDRVRIRFGVETQEVSAGASLDANSTLMKDVIAALRGNGVTDKEISTTQLSVQAVYDQRQDPASGRREQVLTGYRTRNVLLVETPRLEKVATILDAAVEAGANRVDGVEFALARETSERMQQELIAEAVRDARDRAERALAPLDQVIAGVQNLSVSGPNFPSPRYAEAPMLEMTARAATSVFSGDQEVSVTVNITFLIEPARD